MKELPHIRYLYVVDEVFRHKRIGSAAEAANMSQPAATQALARVEKLLGVSLFERQPRGMVPTEPGSMFQKRLSRILEQLRRGDSRARKKVARTKENVTRHAFHRLCSPVQLRALLAIAKTGSFNQAARELGVSQPGVHRAIRELASLSGLPLFEQTRGGVILSPAAEIFTHQVRLATSEFQQAVFEINEFLGQDTTTINVGSLPLSRAAILPRAIDRLFSEVGSSVQVNCFDARYLNLLRDLRFGELDVLIGALRSPAPASDVVQEELFIDELALIASPNHPLAQRSSITVEDTLDYPWIAPPKETPSGTFLFERLGIHKLSDTPVRIISSSLVLTRSLMDRGDYVSIASKRQIETDENAGNLVQLPIELAGSGRAIGLTFRKGWAATPTQNKFLNIIREQNKHQPS